MEKNVEIIEMLKEAILLPILMDRNREEIKSHKQPHDDSKKRSAKLPSFSNKTLYRGLLCTGYS